MRIQNLIKLSLLIGLMAGLGAFAQARYRIVQLAPYGTTNNAKAVSDAGTVVGSRISNKATKWDVDGQFTDLSVLIGPSFSSANDLNGGGKIVGYTAGSTFTQAFSIENGVATLHPQAREAWAVNSHGQWIGDHASLPQTAAILWDPVDGYVDLNVTDLVFGTYGRAINDHGQAAGFAMYPSGSPNNNGWKAVLWEKTANGWSFSQLPQALHDGFSRPSDMNNHGVIVGETGPWIFAQVWGPEACLWQEFQGQWVIRTLGTLGGTFSAAYGINNQNQIVGWSNTADGNGAFLFEDGVMHLLEDFVDMTSDWKYLDAAFDISDSGYIVGMGIRSNNVFAPFLLVPYVDQILCE